METPSANSPTYSLGLDYGTSSVRALITSNHSANALSSAVCGYAHGEDGILLDSNEPDLARQAPSDYLTGAKQAIRESIAHAQAKDPSFDVSQIVGLGVDTTGSTPIPVDRKGQALALAPAFADHIGAQAWLWKDHTAAEEAQEISDHARKRHPEYLESCGGSYSSEWFWAKLLKMAREHPKVVEQTHGWIEICDWIPAVLTGNTDRPVRGICAAGHKGLYHDRWGGYPERSFWEGLHPECARIWNALEGCQVQVVGQMAGRLSPSWALECGLPSGIPVSTGALDAHMGAVGSGIQPGTMVKIMGTSACDIVVAPLQDPLPYISGLCGMAPETVIPNCHGIEAGQSAVGDLFHWCTDRLLEGSAHTHDSLSQQASMLRPGQSGLLALDWNNGNRSLLCDPQLTGLLIGQTLHTKAHEVYRALIEATAFGARMIIDQMKSSGILIDTVVACGGLADKNPLLMQIYADILGLRVCCSASEQTCALGSAMAGSVASGSHPDIQTAQKSMVSAHEKGYTPNPEATKAYDRLFSLYRQLHDSFGGVKASSIGMGEIMKELIRLRRLSLNGSH